jgi:hypothetical protein
MDQRFLLNGKHVKCKMNPRMMQTVDNGIHYEKYDPRRLMSVVKSGQFGLTRIPALIVHNVV